MVNRSERSVKIAEDWYEKLSPQAKASIQKGIKDADNNRFVPYSEVKAKLDKLLGR